MWQPATERLQVLVELMYGYRKREAGTAFLMFSCVSYGCDSSSEVSSRAHAYAIGMKCHQQLGYKNAHFQTMLKTKLNVLTLRKEPLPTVIFHEPEAIELCTTTPLMKTRNHTGCKGFYPPAVYRGVKITFSFQLLLFCMQSLLVEWARALLCSAAKVHDMSTWADRELWKAQGQFCSVTLVVKDYAIWLLCRLIAAELKHIPREWVGGNVAAFGEAHRPCVALALIQILVTYLGKVSTTGMQFLSGCTEKPVIELWKKHTLAREDIYPANALLEIRPFQVWLHHLDLKGEATVHMDTFQVARIAYCTADHNVSPNIFAWVYREINDDLSYQMDCHAVECESKLEAKKLAHAMMEAFKKTFHSMKSDGRIHRNSSSEEMSHEFESDDG
ncbi:Pid1 [Columba guinea]|nr:Pid1 [Columba guinea]